MIADDLATAVVIDDDPAVRHLLSQVFEAAGFSVISAETGADGARAVVQTQPLVATVDLLMPGVDGIETVRQVRAAGSTTHLIIVTASDEESDVVLSLSAGADEYLVKPVRVREMRARIDAVLRRARAARDDAAITEPTPLPPAPWVTPAAATAAYVPDNPWPQESPVAAHSAPGAPKQYVFTAEHPARPVVDG